MIERRYNTRNPSAAALIRLLMACAIVCLGAASAYAWPPEWGSPTFPESALEVHTHGRLFYSAGDITGMLEYVGRFEGVNRDFRYQSVTLGGYYRIIDNLKGGLFYKLQVNDRHDDDWILDGSNWIWTDASARVEHLVMSDLTPRFLMGFLPGENWVLSSKLRYAYNFTTTEQTLLVRPGLTWFWIRDREPVLNVTAQYATYFSLNFGAVPWYKQGPYLNLLYHVSPNVQIDVSASRQWVYWSESQAFRDSLGAGAAYLEHVYSPWLVDVGFILRFR